MDWSTFLSAISGAVVGGGLTGFFTLLATKKSFDHQLIQTKESEERLVTAILQSIHDEIETLMERYQEAMGAQIETLAEGEALAFYYPLISDFFTVYNGNSSVIGRIRNNDLRKQIIKTYTLAKGLVDSYRLNNDLVAKWEFSEKLFAESQMQLHKEMAEANHAALVNYARALKEAHQKVKYESSALLRDLRKHGVLDEK